jgi:hypothetical protein
MTALFTESKNLNIINMDLKNEIARLEVVRDTQISEIAEWKRLFHFYQGLSLEFAKELELLVPPKFDANAISSLIA